MRIAVFGTGGAAGYFGGRLAEAGEDVTFIARGAHLDAIRAHGLRVDSVRGNFEVAPAQATDDPSAVGPVDVVILGVKTWQVAEAAQAMAPLLGPETVVIPLQNGVEVPDQLVKTLGRKHVLGGLASIFSFIEAPGHIRHIGGPGLIAFGELDNRRSERVRHLREAFERAAGLAVDTPSNIHISMWEKFLFVVPLGSIGAVTRAPVGILRQLPETRAMLEQAMREIFELAHARGVPLTGDIIPRTLAVINALMPHGTTSLQRDVMAGRPSELEAWTGAVVRLGLQSAVETPTHTLLYHSLLPQELSARGRLQVYSNTGS